MLQARINGITYRALREFSIEEQTGNNTSSTISVVVDDVLSQPIPVSGDIIELIDTDSGERIFYGQCGIPKSPKFQTGRELLVYSIVCSNANAILANRIINVSYKGWTVSEIVQDLYTRYIADEGITLGQITQTDVTLEAYNAGNFNLQSAMDELADSIGACWQITNDKEFLFIGYEDFPRFPQVIDQDFLLGTDLQSSTTDYKQRTVQYVSGGYAETDTQVETFVYDGDTDTFTTAFPLIQQPSISINGEAVSPDKIGVAGIDDNTEGLIFRWAYNSTTISYISQSGALTAGDTVSVSYVGQYPIRVVMSNSTKIAEIAAATGTSGMREQVYYDSTVTSIAQAREIAANLLQRFEEATSQITFWLLSSELYASGLTLDNLSLYTLMEFDLPSIGISGEYVITERRLEPYFADLSDTNQKLKVTLTLKNRDYLKSYGETITDIKKDVNGLNYRGDETILTYETVTEPLTLKETYAYNWMQRYFAAANVEQGSVFAPCDLGNPVFPAPLNLTAGGNMP